MVLRESCFYRRLTDTSKDEENQEESDQLQDDMLGGFFVGLFFCHKFPESYFYVNYNESSVELNFLQKLIDPGWKSKSLAVQK